MSWAVPDGVKAMNNETMWYNGCYLMTSYVQGNEKYLPEPSLLGQRLQTFDTVTIKMIESNDVGYQLYQTGEADYIDLTESNLATINGNEDNEFHDQLVSNHRISILTRFVSTMINAKKTAHRY